MVKQSNTDVWIERMRDKPCYRPAVPFYDFCLNCGVAQVKRLDCDKCVREKKLKDYIE